MKTTCNVRRKKGFPALLLLLVLTVALSVGTTLGKYYEEIPISDLDTGELEVELILYDPPSGEGPGIVEETPTTVYQVQPGDTLSSIAEKFHTTVEALAAYNNIADPDKIPPMCYCIFRRKNRGAEGILG